MTGLREMFNKSGKCTLDTFREILHDISSLSERAEPDRNVGFQILKNIQNTMSDRAGTEKTFNRLLEEFRKEVLPQVVDNWDALTEEQQKPISAMNNFFCGLHLLVGMADVAEESLKKFERNFLDGKLIGSAAVPELKNIPK